MKRILSNDELIVGQNYIARSKTNGTHPGYQPVAEVTKVKELSGIKVIFDRMWATDDNNQALDRYEIYGPIDLDDMIESMTSMMNVPVKHSNIENIES